MVFLVCIIISLSLPHVDCHTSYHFCLLAHVSTVLSVCTDCADIFGSAVVIVFRIGAPVVAALHLH